MRCALHKELERHSEKYFLKFRRDGVGRMRQNERRTSWNRTIDGGLGK